MQPYCSVEQERFKCKRCGECCYYSDKDGIRRKCRYLARTNTNLTFCRIYAHRIGVFVGIDTDNKAVFCKKYPKCPYEHLSSSGIRSE